MAELVDALASGASGLTVVEVRVFFRALLFHKQLLAHCGWLAFILFQHAFVPCIPQCHST